MLKNKNDKMKKTVFLIIGILIISVNINAEIAESRFKITESVEEFDLFYFLTPDMKVIENKDNNDINVTQSFEIIKNNIRGKWDTGNAFEAEIINYPLREQS